MQPTLKPGTPKSYNDKEKGEGEGVKREEGGRERREGRKE